MAGGGLTAERVAPRRAAAPRLAPAVAATAVAGLAFVVLEPRPADLAAAVFRAELFADEGFAITTDRWYGGFSVLGYSILVPPLSALLGPWLVAALATVAAVWCFAAAFPGHPWAGGWFAFGAVASLYAGRVPFAVGLALGMGAVLAERRERPRLALGLALAAPLASPVAGAFLGLAAVAWRRWALAGAAVAPAALLAVLLPSEGTFPFAPASFWTALALTGAALALSPPGLVRTGLVLYAAALVAAFLVPTPMGGNAVRMGMLFAGPALAIAAPRRAAWLALPLLAWTAAPAVRDLAATAGDPSVHARFWAPVKDLEGPVEVVFTRNHWETAHVARHTPIARGWERQVDRGRNGLFYEPPGAVTPRRYERWLRERGIRHVVLPEAPLDRSAREEAVLVRSRPSYLHEIRRTDRLRIYRVRLASADGA